MDQDRFDQLARRAAQPRSRRGLVRVVLAGGALGLGGVIGGAGVGTSSVDAQNRKKKKCKAPLTKCGKKCVDLTTNARNCGTCKNSCAVEIDCVGGTCQCRDLNAACETDGQCCSGKCSTEVISTCRKSSCVETGHCGVDSDCCGGFCVGGCCQGVC